jgi:hypothetical protein
MGQHEARDDAGHEEGAHRAVGGDGVHHHDDGGRDQDAQPPGGGDGAGPEAHRETPA